MNSYPEAEVINQKRVEAIIAPRELPNIDGVINSLFWPCPLVDVIRRYLIKKAVDGFSYIDCNYGTQAPRLYLDPMTIKDIVRWYSPIDEKNIKPSSTSSLMFTVLDTSTDKVHSYLEEGLLLE